jgi:galactokinase/mevalonate kinase-like predicted kinase
MSLRMSAMKRRKLTHREKMARRMWQRMLPDEIAELNKMMEEDWQEPKEEDDEVQGVCAY